MNAHDLRSLHQQCGPSPNKENIQSVFIIFNICKPILLEPPCCPSQFASVAWAQPPQEAPRRRRSPARTPPPLAGAPRFAFVWRQRLRPGGPGGLAVEGTLQRTATVASNGRFNTGGNDTLCCRPAIRDVLVDRPAGVVTFALGSPHHESATASAKVHDASVAQLGSPGSRRCRLTWPS